MGPQDHGCFQMLGENLCDWASREFVTKRDNKGTAREVNHHFLLFQLGRLLRRGTRKPHAFDRCGLDKASGSEDTGE